MPPKVAAKLEYGPWEDGPQTPTRSLSPAAYAARHYVERSVRLPAGAEPVWAVEYIRAWLAILNGELVAAGFARAALDGIDAAIAALRPDDPRMAGMINAAQACKGIAQLTEFREHTTAVRVLGKRRSFVDVEVLWSPRRKGRVSDPATRLLTLAELLLGGDDVARALHPKIGIVYARRRVAVAREARGRRYQRGTKRA